jgi:prepilin-type N-terminal cleavage/methylation domain-containing protein
MPSPAPTARPGFTVMESVVAMSVLAIAIAGAAFMMTSAYGSYRHQDRRLDTDRLVHDQLETFSATTYPMLAAEIDKARKPDAPTPPDAPTTGDFAMSGTGEATARYDLAPPGEGADDWTPKPVFRSLDGKPVPIGETKATELHAQVRLQYWDPNFDAPSASDRGLIRATFALQGGDVNESATKYLARTICQDVPGSP